MSRLDLKKGIALVLVLWAVALLSALAMAASASFRGFAAVISVSQDKAKAGVLLNAGLEAAAAVAGHLGDAPLTDRTFDITLATGSAHVRLSDEAGRIDINKAPVKLLTALLRSVGIDNAEALAKAIDAARTHSDAAPGQTNAASSTTGGANQSPLSDAGSDKPPAFTDVAQLGRIVGLTPDVIAAIAPLVTIFGNEKINALTAPSEVLDVLPNVTRAQVAALLDARLRPGLNEGQAQAVLGSAGDFVTAPKKRSAASVEITARLVDGYGEAATATIIVLPHDSSAYRVLRWSPAAFDRGAIAETEP